MLQRSDFMADNLEKQTAAQKDQQEKVYVNYKEHLYDKLPVTKKQMDVVVGVLMGLLILVLIIGIARAG